MNIGKAIKKANTLNGLASNNPNVEYDVVGEGQDCYVRQINTCPKTGNQNYGVAAY